jgi:hypothetical protein
MSSPPEAAFRVSARARRMILRVSQPASHRFFVRSLSKQCASACGVRNQTPISAVTTGSRITCRRRSRLVSSPEPSSLLTFVVSSAHTFTPPGIARGTTKGITDDSIRKGPGP